MADSNTLPGQDMASAICIWLQSMTLIKVQKDANFHVFFLPTYIYHVTGKAFLL